MFLSSCSIYIAINNHLSHYTRLIEFQTALYIIVENKIEMVVINFNI